MGRPRKTDGDEKEQKKREGMRRLYEEQKRRKEEGEDEEEAGPGRPKDEGGGEAKKKRQERNARYYSKRKGRNVLKVKILGNRTSPQSPASIVRTSKVWIAGGAFETRCYIRDNKSMGRWMSNMVIGHVKFD